MFIFDIDGVLADVTHLLPLINQSLPKEKRDYDQYYKRIGEALPIEGGKILGQGLIMHKVVFITGRRESSRCDTVAWLLRHFKPMQRHDCLVYMRPDDDERPAHEVKRDLFAQMQKDYFNANHWPRTVEASEIVVFEDDRRCVEMYKQLGCYVNHVKHDKARS